jgi:hypothetical protein
MRKIIKIEIISIILVTMFISCAEKQPEIMDHNLVKFSGQNKISLTEVKNIHLKEDADNLIGTPLSIQVDNRNNIYLADHSRLQVIVFDDTGHFKRTIGRAGEGPGEFRYCMNIRLHKNMIGVSDWRLNRISIFDTSSIFLYDMKLTDDPNFRNMPGYFDYSPDGNLIYVGISENLNPLSELIKKTKTVCIYKDMKPLTLFGKYDSYMLKYGEEMFPWTLPRTDSKGNIYTIQPSIPRVTKYDSSYEIVNSFSFYSDEFKMPYGQSKKVEINDPNVSRIQDFYVGERTGNIYLLHYYLSAVNAEKKTMGSEFFLTVLNAEGNILAVDIPIPSTPGFCIDQEENIYYFKNVEPDNVVIAKAVLEPK